MAETEEEKKVREEKEAEAKAKEEAEEAKNNSNFDRAEKHLEERKKIVEEEKKILDRKEKIIAIEQVGGQTVAGQEDKNPKKEETNHEYRERIQKEMAEGKTDFKEDGN